MRNNYFILLAKFKKLLAQLPYLPKALALVWAASRRWTAVWLALLVAQGLLPVATVYLTRALVNRLVIALGSARMWADFKPVLVLAVIMAVIFFLGEMFRTSAGWVRVAQAELIQDHLSALIHEKSVSVDLAFYESPDYYDHLHRARGEATYRPLALLESVGGLLQTTITLVGMVTVLAPFGLWLPFALVLSTLPAFYVVLRYNLRQHHWRLRTTADERRTWYYDHLLTNGENAAEIRLFDLGAYFSSAFQRIRARLRGERLNLARSQALAELCASAITFTITGALLTWMVLRTMQGSVTLGDLALFYQAISQGQRLASSLLENVGQIYSNSLFLSNLFAFLALKPQVVDPVSSCKSAPHVIRDGIRFRQVTFRYPLSEHDALNKFDLMIPARKVVAIVGLNGAGKSTLIKLLCRLYDPEEGRIEWDGADLREFPLKELRRLVTVLFQQPVHYSATVRENVALGDAGVEHGRGEIEAAAQAAGAHDTILKLPNAYESILGKWFEGGTELSVGEWQRLALARAYLRRSPLILLDEPTSALDPWAEADWLRRFKQIASGRTAVIITHRFTTAMHADTIHVMVEGKIVESGSHHELLTRDGLYAKSWLEQMGEGVTQLEAI